MLAAVTDSQLMPDYAECPLDGCALSEPHPHPVLGEGLWAPKPLDAIEAALNDGSPEKIADALHRLLPTVPCVCACGAQFEGLQFTALREGETRRLRTCDRCLDAAQARLEAKAAQDAPRSRAGAPRRPETPPKPLRIPYADE